MKNEKPILIHFPKPTGSDLWLMSQELQWTLKFWKQNTFVYVNNLSKRQLRELSQLIYNRTGIKPRLDKE